MAKRRDSQPQGATATYRVRARFGPIVVITTSRATYRLEPGAWVEVPDEVLAQLRDSGLGEAVEVAGE